MTIEVELTKEDIINFNMIQQQRRCSQARPTFWKNVAIWFAIGIIMVFVFEMLPQNVNRLAPYFFGIIIVMGVLALFLVIFRKTLLKFQLKRLVTEHSSGIGKFLYSLSEIGLNETSANSEGLTKWVGIVEFIKNAEYILLYTGDNAAFIFPKRCFQTAEEMQRFTDQVTQWTHLDMITLDSSM